MNIFAKTNYLTKKGGNGKLWLIVMSVPFFVILLAFSYVPLFGWVYAFFDSTNLSRNSFVGLKYITMAVTKPEVLTVVINTMAISLINIILGLTPIILAIMILELKSTKYQRVIQTITTIPNFISWILVYSFMYNMFYSEGLVNTLLLKIDPGSMGVNVLGNAEMAWIVQCLIALWKSAGWSAVIYIAAMTGIDQSLYEAAVVDGAGRFRKIWHITLPGISETYLVLLLLNIASMLSNGFDQFFVFNNPMVGSKLNVLDYYVYVIGIKYNIISFSTAISIYKSVISIALLFLCNLLAKRIRGVPII